MCPIIQDDVPGSSIDKNVHCERTGQTRAKKYLREATTTVVNARQLTLWPH